MSESVNIVCPKCNAVNRVPGSRLGQSPKCGKCKSDVLAGPVDLTSANFTQHISRNDQPVVVDFWASWCGPCKMMAPAFAHAAAELRTQIRFAKLNTEIEQSLAGQFAIRSIPTMILFKNGQEVSRQSGALDAQSIISWAKSAA